MTYRERREAKAERLREWADKREARSAANRERSDQLTAGIPFGQPILVGHHSERRHRNALDKSWDAMGRAVEDGRKAESMRSRADHIEAAAEHAIYSDDPDAVDRLKEKLAGLEAKREQRKAANAAFRKEHRAELKEMTAYERNQAVPFPSYSITNLGGVISNTRKRIAQLEREAVNGGPADRFITARYGGPCEDCGASLEKGQTIRYSRANGARCVECTKEEA